MLAAFTFALPLPLAWMRGVALSVLGLKPCVKLTVQGSRMLSVDIVARVERSLPKCPLNHGITLITPGLFRFGWKEVPFERIYSP